MTDWSERIRALVDRHSSAPPGHVLRDQILAEIREYAFELLTEALAEREREVGDRFLSWRGVDDPCKTCGGTGQRPYPNTSTWLRGSGGQAITPDVCDQCWGTGDKHRRGVDLNQKHSEMTSLTAERDQLLILRPLANRLRETLEKREAVILEHARTIMELRAELDQLHKRDGELELENCNALGELDVLRPSMAVIEAERDQLRERVAQLGEAVRSANTILAGTRWTAEVGVARDMLLAALRGTP